MSSLIAAKQKLILSAVACLGVLALSVPSVQASNPTLDVIGPHEYSLPVNYKSFNVFVQYAYYQSENEAFSPNGGKAPGPHTAKAVGLSKYVRFFTLDSLPNVGLAYEVILPEISVQGKGVNATGIGDPITGPAMWFKPTANSTFGIQSFLQIPMGTKDVSDGSWKCLTSFLYDIQLGKFNIDGDTGFVYQSKAHRSGLPDVDPGTTFHQNLRFGYRAHQYIEPFIAYDFGITGSAKDENGKTIANSATYEHAVGGGLMFHFSDNISLTARYSYGIDGTNTNRTNSLNIKFAYVW
ncbi:MAG: transporter [Desulfuromonadales bacterium]|nr:transporter [Desulfuromonadales bacterium]